MVHRKEESRPVREDGIFMALIMQFDVASTLRLPIVSLLLSLSFAPDIRSMTWLKLKRGESGGKEKKSTDK